MPRIDIREQELQTFVSFDSTENSVLIPLYTTNATFEAEKFVSVSSFRSKYNSSNVGKFNDGGETLATDLSFAMACELLNIGLPVVIMPIFIDEVFDSKEALIEDLNTRINTNGIFTAFKSKNLYNIKFITSGAYPNVFFNRETNSESSEESGGEISISGSYETLMDISSSRGDAVALVEFEPDIDEKSLLEYLQVFSVTENGSYACATYPAGLYTCPASGLTSMMEMPGSFGYLMAYGNSVRTNANWFAAAGVIRGYVPNLIKLNYSISEATMHILQGDNTEGSSVGVFVNTIMEVGSYGIRLWGNRTLYKTSASAVLPYSAFLNVRILVCDIKKQLYHSSLRITFEPNDDISWINFKKLNNTLLDRMQSGRGVQWYRWTKVLTEQKATIKAILTVKPIEAVEYFDLTVFLTDDEEELEVVESSTPTPALA